MEIIGWLFLLIFYGFCAISTVVGVINIAKRAKGRLRMAKAMGPIDVPDKPTGEWLKYDEED